MYNALFQPLRIGPKLLKNRLFAASHGVGFGYRDPDAMLAIRKMKAEGGWAAVATEQTEIHPTSDLSPYSGLRAWDADDLPVISAVSKAIQGGGALSAIELCHSGLNVSNLGTREVPIGPTALPTQQYLPAIPEPFYAREMSLADIEAFRQWHIAATKLSIKAGYDIVLVFAMGTLSLLHQFLNPRLNRRRDKYGGSLENRARLLIEVLDDTRAVLGKSAALGVRLSVADLLGDPKGPPEALYQLLNGKADFWDLSFFRGGVLASGSGRSDFDGDAYLHSLEAAREVFETPLTTTRFFDTPDAMNAAVKSGLIDFVTVARQSISDPFFPQKLAAGELEAIRPCIKCNICVSGDLSYVPVSCTQNPAFGEEWRRGWHPEIPKISKRRKRVMVIGAGSAGLEASLRLSERGHKVTLLEQNKTVGGRVNFIAQLPGLDRWHQVVDYRLKRLLCQSEVALKTDQLVTLDWVINQAQGYDHIALATGAKWRLDVVDRTTTRPLATDGSLPIYPPTKAINLSSGKTLIFDLEHYQIASQLALLRQAAGDLVTLATPCAEIAPWTHKTMEQQSVQAKLLRAGIQIVPHVNLSRLTRGEAELRCVFTDRAKRASYDRVILVGLRQPSNMKYALEKTRSLNGQWTAIGEADVPGTVGQSVRSGFKFALEFEEAVATEVKRTRPLVGKTQRE